jgi:hypothetical protein
MGVAMHTVVVIVTARDLEKLRGCETAVHEILRLPGVERIEISLCEEACDDVLAVLRRDLRDWSGSLDVVKKVSPAGSSTVIGLHYCVPQRSDAPAVTGPQRATRRRKAARLAVVPFAPASGQE